MAREFDIREELKKLPEKPGVYLMHDASDEIIYVGKAVVLKNRVRQYFQSPRGKSEKIRRMVERINWFAISSALRRPPSLALWLPSSPCLFTTSCSSATRTLLTR